MAAFSTLIGSLQSCIVEILGYAAAYDRAKNPKHHGRLDELLDIWAESGYFSQDYIRKLREVVRNSFLATTGSPVKYGEKVEKEKKKDLPFVMPSTHGDPLTPYYDLPAGNLMPHMIPNSTVPLQPESIKPLQFLAGPADDKLVTALQAFLDDVDRMYAVDKDDGRRNVDLDELGETVVRDEVTGEPVDGDTYYGWSREFCHQMKKRRSPSRGRSYSDSPGNSDRYSPSLRERSYSPRPVSLSPRPPPSLPSYNGGNQQFPPPPPSPAPPPPPPLNYNGPWPPSPPPLPYPLGMAMPPGVFPHPLYAPGQQQEYYYPRGPAARQR